MYEVRSSRRWLVSVLAVLLLTQTGCLQILQARARADREQKEAAEKAALNAFLADFNAAFEAGKWSEAAATFTLEREKALVRYGGWSNNLQKLWHRLSRLAESAGDSRDYDSAIRLCATMDAVPATLPKGMRTEIDREKARWTQSLEQQMSFWNKQVEPAKADEDAGAQGVGGVAARLGVWRAEQVDRRAGAGEDLQPGA